MSGFLGFSWKETGSPCRNCKERSSSNIKIFSNILFKIKEKIINPIIYIITLHAVLCIMRFAMLSFSKYERYMTNQHHSASCEISRSKIKQFWIVNRWKLSGSLTLSLASEDRWRMGIFSMENIILYSGVSPTCQIYLCRSAAWAAHAVTARVY